MKTYIPERIYTKLNRQTAIRLAELAKMQDDAKLQDPRALASKLLAEKVEEVYLQVTNVIQNI